MSHMKLIKRSAQDWAELIEEHVPEYAIVKVACVVWWDCSNKKAFGTTQHAVDWFFEKKDEYVREEHEIPGEELCGYLIAIGYRSADAKKRTREKAFESEVYKERQKTQKRERNGQNASELAKRLKELCSDVTESLPEEATNEC